jgi:hypothetical protein
LLADGVLALHVAIAVFVVAGALLVVFGNLKGWRWVNQPLFRYLHLGAILFVVVQAWMGRRCPLTALEMALRLKSGDEAYAGSFMQHWLQRLLYYDAPAWVFVAVYTAFGALVVGCWWYFPPNRVRRGPGPA